MSKLTLERLLDSSSLARVVPYLAPETLHQLIRHRGLEACGVLVTSATPAQLTSLLELDLWRQARPGRDDHFDVDRFGEWLEVLVDAGDAIAARTIAALDNNLVIAGLARYVRVFDPGIFEPVAQSDDEMPDRHRAMREGDAIHAVASAANEWMGDRLECELGGYLVRARRTDAWDAIVALMLALDADYPDEFHALMQGCRRLSNSRPETTAFDDLLLAPEQHLHELTLEREQRRSQQGYATPADARAFLQMARQHQHTPASTTAPTAVNAIVSAYFRATAEDVPAPAVASGLSGTKELDAVIELLAEAGMVPGRPRALLASGEDDPHAPRFTRLRPLMSYVRDHDEAAYLTRTRELAFLANTLLAGCSVQSRPFTPQEASDAAAAICNLGLDYWPEGTPAPADKLLPESLLIDHDLVTIFEVGWSMLHRDVSLFTAQQLIATLAAIDCVDRDMRLELVALRRTLMKYLDAGTPWRARGAAEILAMLDTTAWVSVLGLLDECPVVPAALTAVLEGSTTTVSAGAFEFISTASQIGDVRIFMRKLPDLLSA